MFKIKIGIILLITFSISSCSILKRGASGVGNRDGVYRGAFLLRDIRENNLSNESFRIDRMRVLFENESSRHRFSGNIKYLKEGKIIFSARVIAGIEVARIYLDRNDIVVIDRINRIYYSGETNLILSKYGLSWSDIVVLFGDLPPDLYAPDRVKCQNDSLSLIASRNSVDIGFVVNCQSLKLLNIKSGDKNSGVVTTQFSDEKRVNGFVYPGSVKVVDSKDRFDLDITYDEVSEYSGSFEKPGVPGGYEIEKLF
jgi:hypothetical protein